MLLSTYNQNCQATCPKCGLVHCLMTGGNLAMFPRYMDFKHEKCGSEWRHYLDEYIHNQTVSAMDV